MTMARSVVDMFPRNSYLLFIFRLHMFGQVGDVHGYRKCDMPAVTMLPMLTMARQAVVLSKNKLSLLLSLLSFAVGVAVAVLIAVVVRCCCCCRCCCLLAR